VPSGSPVARDEDQADDQRGAEAGGQRDLLVEQDGAEHDATSGFTYWCVTTFEIGAFRSSQVYAVKPISVPTSPR
jgi:hypothetical protein